ncbi:MAG: hypothetical protein QOE55_4808 [Acidobacteriaceae bacterium]|jgi:hypothetical protein|nr:hypothetical protein [Acidobacteriaceae bacterium]
MRGERLDSVYRDGRACGTSQVETLRKSIWITRVIRSV